ncbi:383_t:CDS:1, partial [Entrophospora sp. SA101]
KSSSKKRKKYVEKTYLICSSFIIREVAVGNFENLFDMFNKITNVEIRNEITNQKVTRCYFSLESSYPYSSSITMINLSMHTQLKWMMPIKILETNARLKRKERTPRIYFFNAISDGKIG